MKIVTIKKCDDCGKVNWGILNNKEVLICGVTNSKIKDLRTLNSDCPYKNMEDQRSKDCFNGLCPVCGEEISKDFLCSLDNLQGSNFTLIIPIHHKRCHTQWDIEVKCIKSDMTFEVTNIRDEGNIFVNNILKPVNFEGYSLFLCPVCSTDNVKFKSSHDPDYDHPITWRKVCIIEMTCEHGHSWLVYIEHEFKEGKTHMLIAGIKNNDR